MLKVSTILLMLSFFGLSVLSQDNEYLRPLLKGKKKLTEVMAIVEQHFKSPETKRRLGDEWVQRYTKYWKRWEYYMESRTGPNGEFVNINKLIDEAATKLTRTAIAQQLTNAPNSLAGSWSSLGPTSSTGGLGRVDRIAFHPTDANTVFAGTSGGGLWKTVNGGSTWTNLTPNIPSTGISGIVVDPTNPDHIYILTGDGDSQDFGGLVAAYGYTRFSIGVLETFDGGTLWRKTGAFPDTSQFIVGFALAMDPDNTNILLAATDKGLFRTNNGGDSWSNVLPLKCHDVVFKPSGTTAYAITRDSDNDGFFWFSPNNGFTWDSTPGTNSLLKDAGRCKIAVTPVNANVVYLVGGKSPDSGQYAGTYRSTTSGTNFVLRSNTPNIMGRKSTDNYDQDGYDLSYAVKPSNQSTVVSGAVKVWRNTAGALTGSWVDISDTHADIHELRYNPLDDKLWAATDGGMYYSTDDGTNWTEAYNGMTTSQIYHMAVRPGNYLQLLTGLQDNGVKYKNSGAFSYQSILGLDGYFVGFDAAFDSIFYAIANTTVQRFTANGNNSSDITPNNQMDDFFPSLAINTATGNTLYIASDSFWRSSNGGASWNVTPNLPGKWYIRTCPSNSNRIYMAGRSSGASFGVLRKSENAGVSWLVADIISGNPGYPVTTQRITCINVDPTNSLRVWITFGGFEDGVKVFYSANGGDTWSNRSGTLPNIPVNSIALDNLNNAYVGTDLGVFYRGAAMSDWVPFYNNLPFVPVTDLVISQAEERIRASTFGRGVWSSDLYNSCTDSLNIAGTLEGQEFYEASSFISSIATLQPSEGTKVIMRAGNGIQFTPGFMAQANAQLAAVIGGCGTGGVADILGKDSGQTITSLPSKQFYYPVGGRNAAIEITSTERNQANVVTHVFKPGQIRIVLKDASGKAIKDFPVQDAYAGDSSSILAIPDLANGMYYLHVYHNDRWEHMQELEIR